MMWAMVVFPVPGAPQRIMDGILPCSIAVRKMLPLPVRCCCHTRSSNVEGLTRSAKGTDEFILQISEEYLNQDLLFTTAERLLICLIARSLNLTAICPIDALI